MILFDRNDPAFDPRLIASSRATDAAGTLLDLIAELAYQLRRLQRDLDYEELSDAPECDTDASYTYLASRTVPVDRGADIDIAVQTGRVYFRIARSAGPATGRGGRSHAAKLNRVLPDARTRGLLNNEVEQGASTRGLVTEDVT